MKISMDHKADVSAVCTENESGVAEAAPSIQDPADKEPLPLPLFQADDAVAFSDISAVSSSSVPAGVSRQCLSTPTRCLFLENVDFMKMTRHAGYEPAVTESATAEPEAAENPGPAHRGPNGQALAQEEVQEDSVHEERESSITMKGHEKVGEVLSERGLEPSGAPEAAKAAVEAAIAASVAIQGTASEKGHE